MRPALDRRLKRLRAGLMQPVDAQELRREALRARVALGGKLRDMLVARGVDPAQVAALRPIEEAAAELAAMPGGGGRAAEVDCAPESPAEPPSELWETAPGGAEAGGFIRELVRMALLYYADGQRPDPARDSLMQWHAWCLVTPSPGEPSILLDPEVARYRQMLQRETATPR
ncbi:MAG TPA: hypothetical protein VKQ73_06070 [Stellaceae bacterium]|nr:hypothetical protein [Stellaceae bacterium]